MRYVLAFVSFVIAAPFLAYFVVSLVPLFMSGFFSLGFDQIRQMWLLFVFLGVSFLIGFGFLTAGIAILATKSRRK